METKKQGPRSPTATQRHQFRFPPPPGTYWAQLGAPMWRYGLTDRVTARAFARRRTPQNGHAGGLGGARGSSAVEAGAKQGLRRVQSLRLELAVGELHKHLRRVGPVQQHPNV